ncbi:MAG: NADH-quinone oxidoreductase subunit L [Planctomycetia bacterium]|nr:NADH-quinone oxidoreductase subunit L [Planctomycetia bacterium]
MTPGIPTLLILIPALPLTATIVTAVFGRSALKQNSHRPVVLALLGSFVASLMMLAQVRQESEAKPSQMVGWETSVDLWNWAEVPNALNTPPAAHSASVQGIEHGLPAALPFRIDLTLRADALTSIMLAMVTFISLLVAIYASGYMHGDRGYWRFFSYIGLFVFSMTMLVSASNFVLLYVFWEAVGLCSYLLIGFWYEKPEAAAAGKKAFLVNRIGDFGFALALFLMWTTYGTLNFHDAHGIAGILGQTRLADPELYVGGGVATAICLLLMLGACGKSAQFPLHIWLPDAMEGPTPVSALIHAATMVTAGVYMVTRCTPLFMVSPDAQHVVALVGFVTAAIGGVIAMTQTDLKRVLAYSTISQLGYMFLGLGVATLGGITSGMFHLFTHAFFKALLFLGAGSVMHAMGGVVDMRRFGGLRRLMPTTHWTFLFGCLALAGVIPFAGFWSKDAIIAAVQERAHDEPEFLYLYWGALVVAFLTSVYTFRAFFMTFYGSERVPYEAGPNAHESPTSMTVPLTILAACALVVGAYFERTEGFAEFIKLTPSLAYEVVNSKNVEIVSQSHTLVGAISTLVALTGMGLAAFLYLGDESQVALLTRLLMPLYLLSHGKLFFDQIYNVLFVWPLWTLAQASYWIDRVLIDGLVDLVGRIPPKLAALLRPLQTGMVQFYALAMVWGVVILIFTLLTWPTH